MTATGTASKPAPKARPIWSFARRLGVQAVMSVTVMAGLQIAAVNGYDLRDLLPAPAPSAPGPERPVEVAGVPVRFDLPVQAGSALDHILPKAPAETAAAREPAAAEASVPVPLPKPAPAVLTASLPSLDRVAVPSPRPRHAAARPAAPAPVAPVAAPPPPGEAAFDLSPRGVEVVRVAELVREDAPPMPAEAGDSFHVGDLVPSGSALLQRTAELTGSAAHAVTGTATRILDLAR